MKTRREKLEQEIQHVLNESRAENDALKKLIIALQEEELRKNTAKSRTDEPSNHKPT